MPGSGEGAILCENCRKIALESPNGSLLHQEDGSPRDGVPLASGMADQPTSPGTEIDKKIKPIRFIKIPELRELLRDRHAVLWKWTKILFWCGLGLGIYFGYQEGAARRTFWEVVGIFVATVFAATLGTIIVLLPPLMFVACCLSWLADAQEANHVEGIERMREDKRRRRQGCAQ